jgi:hypothetical protein
MAILGYKESVQSIRSFGLPEWLKTRGLAGWLEIATDGLETPARQRIAIEISAHYSEAVSAHLEAGEAEDSAKRTALAELGDPLEAALNFKKSHLTEYEAKRLKWLEWTAAKPLFAMRSLGLDSIPLAGFALLICNDSHGKLDLNFLGDFLLLAYAGFRLIPRLICARSRPRNLYLKELALSYLLTYAALGFTCASIIWLHDQGAFGAFDSALLLYGYAYAFNPGFRIWNKLRKMRDEGHDLPPCQPTSS